MSNFYCIKDDFSLFQLSNIRNSLATSENICGSLYHLGVSLGRKIIESKMLQETQIKTPEGNLIKGRSLEDAISVIITTKDDFEFLGKGIYSVFDLAYMGYFEFERNAGYATLTSSIRSMEIPQISTNRVANLIIAKSVIATGCTAIALARNALQNYFPKNTIIASAFYTEAGVMELQAALPHADLFVVGSPDKLMEDRITLSPGIGHLDQRMKDK
jgi:uracil phosphoribosyltransferase